MKYGKINGDNMNQTNLERMVNDAITKEHITKEYGDMVIELLTNSKSFDNANIHQTQITKFSDFRTEFFNQLDTKTGWGKEQIKTLFNDTYFKMSNENIN